MHIIINNPHFLYFQNSSLLIKDKKPAVANTNAPFSISQQKFMNYAG